MTSAPATAGPALEVRGLQATYGVLQALWDVTFEARSGEVTLILGRNGAGKTTTLRAISGLIAAGGGSVKLAGYELLGLPAYERSRRGLSLVQEGKRIFLDRTVEENILLGTLRVRESRAERRRVCDEAWVRFPALAAIRATRAGLLSGGQQQMVAIAGALAGRPKVLLLDEPSAGLAPAIVDDVLALLQAVCAEGTAVVLVEQNAERALPIADQIVLLDVGRVVMNVAAATADLSYLVRSTYFPIDGQQGQTPYQPGGHR